MVRAAFDMGSTHLRHAFVKSLMWFHNVYDQDCTKTEDDQSESDIGRCIILVTGEPSPMDVTLTCCWDRAEAKQTPSFPYHYNDGSRGKGATASVIISI